MKVPFVIYADFESTLEPMDTCEPDPSKPYTNRCFSHKPYSFAYLLKCSFNDSLDKFEIYRGKDAAKVFVNKIESDIREVYEQYLKPIAPMVPLSKEEEEEFKQAEYCTICEKPFEEGDVKVRDHCHLTGKKRVGAAHSVCNLNFKIPDFIPVIFHNLSGYDCHMFIKELCSEGVKVDVIAQSKEKYISFGKFLHVDTYRSNDGNFKQKYLKLRFIDSFKFLSTSLQNLVENLQEKDFMVTKKFYPDQERFALLIHKGVFPYSFVDSMEKLNNRSLPLQHEFYDNLNEEHISDEEYKRAEKIWNLFGCQTLGDYADVYLKSDVLLLCDVFENFRKICLDIYKLDPAQYITIPSLAWDAMLKLTKVELELLSDIDMIHMLKKGIRGGISQCSERKHIANNKFLPNYDPSEPSSFITYLDARNLYGHSMCEPLPTGGFEWLSTSEIENINIWNISDDSPQGLILEVDVYYPEELHDLHSDLPFLPESMIPPNSNSKIPKLIPNLNNKKKYVVHYRNLQQALRNGLRVTKVHRVLKFNQSRWMKKYIDLNTVMRSKAKNKFEKDLFKLLNNAVFGKTMENVDNRRDIKLLTCWENKGKGRGVGAKELIAKPNFKSSSVFSENFVAIHLDNVKVRYDKPIYVGFSILELSKTVVYGFFYDVIKRNFGENCSLLYTDTDSLIIKVNTDNFYSFMSQNLEHFDTADYKTGNIFNVPVTKAVIGKMKDEFPEDPIVSFYGTGAKAYYVQSLGSEIKKAKGIKKSVIKKELTMDDYKKIVENGGLIFRKMMTFTSVLHDIYTEIKNKVALSYNDDKRFIIPNTTKTLAWGHRDITFFKNSAEQNLEWLLQAIRSLEDSNKSIASQNLDNLIAAIDECEYIWNV